MDIKNVKLQTHKLQAMKNFYKNVLGFNLENETTRSFQIILGGSSIVFSDENVNGEPYYHFALDIPSNQFNEAKEWIKNKTILSTEDGMDEVDFSFISAKSLYFEDPAGNIVEFIARLKDNPTSETPFSLENIQKISEMSLVVDDKIMVADNLKSANIVERSDSEIKKTTLSFMGDRKTKVFLLLVQPGRTWYFSDKPSKIFPIEITLDSGIVLGVNQDNHFFIREYFFNK